jgi:hypothetical protein
MLTDTYGSIPTKVEQATPIRCFLPTYDNQQEIYADIIKELTEASAG